MYTRVANFGVALLVLGLGTNGQLGADVPPVSVTSSTVRRRRKGRGGEACARVATAPTDKEESLASRLWRASHSEPTRN